ncbi:MAG TPA: PQQ-dependent sugar dehydrogenase [Acidimicrobiales bacterium]|nr:PQQ-dependent sugar dehydrogenase [Acidimicrobiales bacterium]
MRRYWWTGLLIALLTAGLVPVVAARADDPQPPGTDTGGGVVLPPTGPLPVGELHLSTVKTGFTHPTAVRVAADGTVFVAEQRGVLKWFDDAHEPQTVLDIENEVHYSADRGLLGLEVDPNWPAEPWVWIYFAKDAAPGGQAPHWGPGGIHDGEDNCPGKDPDGGGCVSTASLWRLVLDPVTKEVKETVPLIDGMWCQQFVSHTGGGLLYGNDGALYVGGGDGGSWQSSAIDVGQHGGDDPDGPQPKNVCGDPPGAVGETPDPVTSEGGSLRAQDLLTPNDPVDYDGTILRVDPATGEALPDNPRAADPVVGNRRVDAMGLRNPFRLAQLPGTSEVWSADVGWDDWEEINAIAQPTASLSNFGWPCYEGAAPQPKWQAANNALCNQLYASGAAVAPAYQYAHDVPPVPGCGDGSVISGIAFPPLGLGPEFRNSVFVSDAYAGCIWAMRLSPAGPGNRLVPDPSTIQLIAGNIGATDFSAGPGNGSLYTVDFTGSVERFDRVQTCPPDDVYEPNDTFQFAVPMHDAVRAIACPNDADWFIFDVRAGQIVSAQATSLRGGSAPSVQLYDPAGNQIPANAGRKATADGEYAARVTNPSSAPIEYTLTAGGCSDDALTNTGSKRAPLAPHVDAVHCPGETEYYDGEFVGGSLVQVDVKEAINAPKVSLTDYDGKLRLLQHLESDGESHFVYAVPKTGTYDMRAFGSLPDSRRPYTVDVSAILTPCGEPFGGDAFEPDEDIGTGAALPKTWPIQGTLCGAGDTDVYAVDAPASPLTAFLAPNTFNTNLELLDGDGNVVAEAARKKVAAGPYDELHYTPAVAGTYYLRVSQPEDHDLDYILNVLPNDFREAAFNTKVVSAPGTVPLRPWFPITASITSHDDSIIGVALDEPGSLGGGYLPVTATPTVGPAGNNVTVQIASSVVPPGQTARTVHPVVDGSPVHACPWSDQCLDSVSTSASGLTFRLVARTSRTYRFFADGAGPTLTSTTPADGATYTVGDIISTAAACTDASVPYFAAGSCRTDVRSVQVVPGLNSLRFQAVDAFGNTTVKTIHYRGVYDFEGFLDPLHAAHNGADAGRIVPLRWRLHKSTGGSFEAAPSHLLSWTRTPVDCPLTKTRYITEYGIREGLHTAGDTTTYELGWNAPVSYAGHCYRATINLDDNTRHSVVIRFR